MKIQATKDGRVNDLKSLLTGNSLRSEALYALYQAMDYIVDHRIYSVWTKKNVAWQEQWRQSEFSGLFGTCSALSLLNLYNKRYDKVIRDASQDLFYMFNKDIDYSEKSSDDERERERKSRCRLLLEQNLHTTLKAVYFLRTSQTLCGKYLDSADCEYKKMLELAFRQIEDAYNIDSGFYSPAKGNNNDISILTTMQAYVVMAERWGFSSKETIKTKDVFLNFLNQYTAFANQKGRLASSSNKFEAYRAKKGFIAGLYAFSHAPQTITSSDSEILSHAVFDSVFDDDIRSGFFTIVDGYTVPKTKWSRDTYRTDSKVLYLESVLRLILANIIPISFLEYLIDDMYEIIETVKQEKQYISWDLSPSFSHNIKGLNVLNSLVELIERTSNKFSYLNITPHIYESKHRTISTKSVVMFLPFDKDHRDAYETVEEVLTFAGFDLWCASNDPYDTSIMDSIYEKLRNAQFVIVDCSGRKPNVMYEAGLSHGLGKFVFLCSYNCGDFPYESESLFESCCYNPNGDINPPPYKDLQASLVRFISAHADEFCLTIAEKSILKERMKEFATKKHLTL